VKETLREKQNAYAVQSREENEFRDNKYRAKLTFVACPIAIDSNDQTTCGVLGQSRRM